MSGRGSDVVGAGMRELFHSLVFYATGVVEMCCGCGSWGDALLVMAKMPCS